MSRPRNPNGVRRAHTRNGKPVRASSIKGRQAPKKRLNAAAKRKAQRKPLLYAAGTLAGLGALDAILTGRFFTAGLLFGMAGGFLVTHYAWQHHKKRQASKPARQKAAEQRREQRATATLGWREARERWRQSQPQTDDEKIKAAGDWSTRMSHRERAAKEGLRRRYETIRYGKEKATTLAAERKSELRHGAYWSSSNWGPNPVEHAGIRRTPPKTGYRPPPTVNSRRVKAAAAEEPSDGPPEMLSAPELNRKTTAARGQEVLR